MIGVEAGVVREVGRENTSVARSEGVHVVASRTGGTNIRSISNKTIVEVHIIGLEVVACSLTEDAKVKVARIAGGDVVVSGDGELIEGVGLDVFCVEGEVGFGDEHEARPPVRRRY